MLRGCVYFPELEGSNRLAAVIQLLRLLPPANRDTLWALLNFLHNIQTHSSDSEDSTTGTVVGNDNDNDNDRLRGEFNMGRDNAAFSLKIITQ